MLRRTRPGDLDVGMIQVGGLARRLPALLSGQRSCGPRFRLGSSEVVVTEPIPVIPTIASSSFVILTMQRNRGAVPMTRSITPRSGRAALAFYSRAKDQAIAELAKLGRRAAPADA